MDNLTIVVPYFNQQAALTRLLASLPADLDVIVVDDCSDEPVQVERENTRVLYSTKKGYFTGAVNAGIRACKTDVLVLNQDVTLTGERWLELIAEDRSRFALIGERIKGNHPTFPFGYVHGVFQFMRRDAIDMVGMMDAETYPLWGASALWQLQICRRGFASEPLAEIPGLWHEPRLPGSHGASIVQLLQRESNLRSQLIRTPPMVSVVIPCFNHGKYLTDAVNSLVGGCTCLGEAPPQTWASFEVIIVDDGSNEDTARVARSLANGWKGVRYHRRDNGGTAAANNTGCTIAVGRFITIMAADDMREPKSLERLVRTQMANPDRFVYDGVMPFRNGQRGWQLKLPPYNCEELPYRNSIPAGIMFPKKAWIQVGGYPEQMRFGREDWAFNVALTSHGWQPIALPEPGYLYRREYQNRSLGSSSRRELYLAQMAQIFPEVYKESSMCCGGDKRSRPMAPSKRRANALQGGIPQGMVLIQYVGRNVGNETWGGPGTAPSGRYYVFGNNDKDRVRYVDGRDVSFFLSVRENERSIFVKVAPAAARATGEKIAEGIAAGIVEGAVVDVAPEGEPTATEAPKPEETSAVEEVLNDDKTMEHKGEVSPEGDVVIKKVTRRRVPKRDDEE